MRSRKGQKDGRKFNITAKHFLPVPTIFKVTREAQAMDLEKSLSCAFILPKK